MRVRAHARSGGRCQTRALTFLEPDSPYTSSACRVLVRSTPRACAASARCADRCSASRSGTSCAFTTAHSGSRLPPTTASRSSLAGNTRTQVGVGSSKVEKGGRRRGDSVRSSGCGRRAWRTPPAATHTPCALGVGHVGEQRDRQAALRVLLKGQHAPASAALQRVTHRVRQSCFCRRTRHTAQPGDGDAQRASPPPCPTCAITACA